jgi:uncharacterized protein (TIGR03435 family)
VRRAIILSVVGVAALIAAARVQVRAQSDAKPLAFEVTSVKANKSETDPGGTTDTIPGRFTVSNTPLLFIINYAYNLPGYRLVGAPDWTWNDRFNIAATYTPATAPADQENVRAMVQRLLADRFAFTAHHEQRDLPVYALVLARSDGRLGPQLHRSDVDCDQWLAEKRPQRDAGGPSAISPSGKRPACMMDVFRRGPIVGGTRTMEQLAMALGTVTGRPVVDRTGVTGAFDIDLRWTSTDVPASPAGSAPASDDGASIFTAVQEQLGLKLEATKSPFDVLVVDHVEQPTPD